MATPPTFTTGAVLTAAQMNAVGLWLVKSQTVGSGVSSVTVTGAFSADYDAYKIIWTNGNASSGMNIGLRLGSAVTGYYGFLSYGVFTGATALGLNDNNNTSFSAIAGGDPGLVYVDIEVIDPFATAITKVKGSFQNQNAFGTYVGRIGSTASFSAFTLIPNVGNMTGGTIHVYGYRKA